MSDRTRARTNALSADERRASLMTTVAITAGAAMAPEFVRVPALFQMFGIKRGTVYQLINSGKIKSVVLRRKGARTGVRLVHVASVREYLESQMR